MATEIKPEKMWAVWNKSFGFYIGTWLSREEAIHYHVASKEPGQTWEFCKKRGDRVVRVEIKAAEQSAHPTIESGRKLPAKKSNRKVAKPAVSG